MRLSLAIFCLCALFFMPLSKAGAAKFDLTSYLHEGGMKTNAINADIWFDKYGHGIPYVAYEVMQDVIVQNEEILVQDTVTSQSMKVRHQEWRPGVADEAKGEAYKIGTAYLGVVVDEWPGRRYLRSILITTIPLFEGKAAPGSFTDIHTFDIFGIKLKEIFNFQRLIDNEKLQSSFEVPSLFQIRRIANTEKIACIECYPDDSTLKVRFYVLHNEFVGLQVFYD